jgi:P4 family phage/plasmid primase-like protien
MRAARRWLTWKYLQGKKPPVGADGLALKEWADPDTWLTWDEAASRMADNPDLLLGFVLGADEDGAWVGVDLDKCRDATTGEMTNEEAAGLVEYLREDLGVYVETSPSGTGLKAFGRGPAPEWVEVNYAVDPPELGGDRALRFFAVMGKGQGDPQAKLDLTGIKAMFTSDGTGGKDAPEPQGNPLPEVVHSGGQNQALFREACRHVRMGKSKDEVFTWVKITQAQRCPPTPGAAPWTDADFWAIVNSAMRYAPQEDTFQASESGDGEAFAHLHPNVRFDHRAKRWLQFDGTRWRPQEAGEVERLALDTMRWRQAAALKEDDPDRKKKRSAHAVGGERMSRRRACLDAALKEHPIASTGQEWDTDTWLLGVRNGVVDLRTGALRAGKPEDNVTKQVAVPFNADAKAPLWEATVADIFKDNVELVDYFQKALGYSITGDCREEVFFLLIGEGRNGKGTLINTVDAILGDYSTSLSFQSLEASKHGQAGGAASPDIAKLAGARFVTASETSGGKFNTAILKGLTGRDPITARHLHAEEFTFMPQLKLWLSVNERPQVTDQSLGFWARPHMIPFLQCYEGREDRTLKDRLLKEADGILAWIIRGTLRWQAEGLERPDSVKAAVAEYRRSQEPLTEWLEERCHLDPEHQETNIWPRDQLTLKRFAKELDKQPTLQAKRTKRGKVWDGIGLTQPGGGF